MLKSLWLLGRVAGGVYPAIAIGPINFRAWSIIMFYFYLLVLLMIPIEDWNPSCISIVHATNKVHHIFPHVQCVVGVCGAGVCGVVVWCVDSVCNFLVPQLQSLMVSTL
ncbi:MAG: hypothetical protein IPP46_06055 [Bacteroidetes bacterium]|nr:hypothetical protein [Bacteroidota bacterium]